MPEFFQSQNQIQFFFHKIKLKTFKTINQNNQINIKFIYSDDPLFITFN